MSDTPYGDEQSLITRAIAAHYKAAVTTGTEARTPSDRSHTATLDGRWYVVLMNGTGVISVYRVHNNGVMRYMRRPPRTLADTP